MRPQNAQGRMDGLPAQERGIFRGDKQPKNQKKKKRNLDAEWGDVRTVRAANNGSTPVRDGRQGGNFC
jgi:hypothetical protein